MHIAEAMQCIDFTDVEPALLGSKGPLVRHDSFEIDKWELGTVREIAERGRFAIVVCLTGRIECDGRQFKPADFFQVPAQQSDRLVRPGEADTSLLKVMWPSAWTRNPIPRFRWELFTGPPLRW